MNRTFADVWLAGVDGCPGGWIAAFVRPARNVGTLTLFSRFADVLGAPQAPVIIAVDMPIGLPERTDRGGRAAENTVRPLLGKRQSSVFSVPSRLAIYADDYAAACDAALTSSNPPRKLSKQLFNIAPKIREVDETLRGDPAIAERVFEVHPELAFWQLNGELALSEPKKIKGQCHEPGLARRRNLLTAEGVPAALVTARPPKGAADDDLIDALACAAIARRIHAGVARPFPNPPQRDRYGLPMAIWA